MTIDKSTKLKSGLRSYKCKTPMKIVIKYKEIINMYKFMQYPASYQRYYKFKGEKNRGKVHCF